MKIKCVVAVKGRSISISYCACVKYLPMVIIKYRVGIGYEEGSSKRRDAVEVLVCFFVCVRIFCVWIFLLCRFLLSGVFVRGFQCGF